MSITLRSAALAVILAVAPMAAHAENGGDRAAAGGAFMSSYSQPPSGFQSYTATPARGYADSVATGSIGRDQRAPRRHRR